MAFTKNYIYELFVTVLVLSAMLSTASAVDCHGKSFHCVNSTHFMICVDLGGGVSQAIDNFYIACPPPTACNGANHFECEFPAPTTPAPSTPSNIISDTTLPWEEIVTASSVGNTTKEFSENYMNTEREITLPEFSITTDTTVDASAKTVTDIYINNELNVTEIVPTTAVETATTQIDYIQQSEDRNITEIQPTTEDVTTVIVRQNTSETWNSNQTESAIASKESTQTTIENLVITETVTEPASVVTDQITQTTTTLLLETAYLNTELPQVITWTQNESGTTNYGTNTDIAQILDKADVTQPTGISNNISPAETIPLSDMIAETITGSTEHLSTVLVDIISTDVYHSSTSAPPLENKKNKSSNANVSVISNLNSVDESGLLENKTIETITVNDTMGETTTFDAWVVISGNENPTTVLNSNIFSDVTDLKIKQDEMTITQTVHIEAITEQPTKKNEKNFTIPSNAKETMDISTREVVSPDIVPTEPVYTSTISNNDQPLTTEASVLLTNEPNFGDTKIDGALLIETAGIASTGPSTMANKETETTDNLKNRATDIIKNESNQADIDSKVINSAYTPTVSNSTHNTTDTKQDDTTNNQTVEISAITEQPTETNDETLTMIAAQNVAIEKISMPSGEAVNPDIILTEPVYEATTDINAKPMTTTPITLVINKPNLAKTKLDEVLLIESVGIASTEQPKVVNEESKKSVTFKNVATVKSGIQSSQAVNLDIIPTEAAYVPTVSKSTQQITNEASHITLPENPSKTEQDGTKITQIINTDAVTEPTKKNEESTTFSTTQNIEKEKTSMDASEVDAPTPTTITDGLPVPGAAPENNMQTKQLSKLAPTNKLRINEPLFSEAVGNVYGTQESFIIKEHTLLDKELILNTVSETAIELTTNTHDLPSTDAIEHNFNKEPTTRTDGGTAKNATRVSTITDNDSNTMISISTNAQSNNNFQKRIDGSNDETKLNEVNSKVTYTNVEKNNHTNADNFGSTTVTDTIIKKGVGEGKINLNEVHDATSKLDVTSEKSIAESLASLQNNKYGSSKQNDNTFVSSGFLSPKEETNDSDNLTVMKQKTASETTPITKSVADSTMQSSTVERNNQAGNINENPLDNYLTDQSNQDKNYQNKFSVTNVKETSLQSNDYDQATQKDSTVILSGSSTPKEESNGITNKNVINQLGEGETTLVIDNAPYSTIQSSRVESNDQASNINWNPLDNYLIDQSNQDKTYQNNYSVPNVTETSVQNNNFDHSKQKDSTIVLSESSTPKDESNGIAYQSVISQLGEGETTLVINNVSYSTTQSSTIESNNQTNNINWNPFDNYLIDQFNKDSESLSKSSVTNAKVDGNDVNTVSLDTQIVSRQPPTTLLTVDHPVYVNLNNNEQNKNIVTQERNGLLENTNDVKILSEVTVDYLSAPVTKILDTKDNFNLKTDRLAIGGLDVLSATTAVNTEATVAEITQDSIQNTPQIIVNPLLVSTVEENGTSVRKSGSNTEFSPNIIENIDTSNKDTLNIALSKNSDNTPRTLTSAIIEDGIVDFSTVKNQPSQSANKQTSQYDLPTHPHDNSEITMSTTNVNTEFSPDRNENIDTSNKDTSNITFSKNSETKQTAIIKDGNVDSPTVDSNNLPSQSVTKLTNQYELPSHSHGYSEMTTSTPNVNHVVYAVDKTSKPMLDVLPLSINNIKLSTSVTDKLVLTDSTSDSQTKNTIILTESYKSTMLNPLYVNSRAQPGDNVGQITTARRIVTPTFNIQTQVKAQPIANTKDPVGHDSDSVDNSQSAVIATTASIIEGANLRPPTGITDYSLQHPQQTEQGFVERTNAPRASHIISRTEASITETNNDNPNNILSLIPSDDVHIGIASQSVPEANNQVTDTPRNNAKTVTQLNNSSTNITSSLYITQKINTPSVTHNPMPNVTNNINKQVSKDATMPFSCISGVRGRYSDRDDCRKFYICVGNNQPIVGNCPENTVFSDIKKLCTKNLSHCIRDNEFKCPWAGRFSDFVKDNVYYICVNHKNHLYKFKFQCQKGYILNSNTVKCIETREIESNESVSISSSDNSGQTDGISALTDSTSNSRPIPIAIVTNSSKSGDDGSKKYVSSKSKKSDEAEESPEKSEGKDDDDDDDELFKCKKEGKFPIRDECRRYYLCKKRRGQYRRKIKKCESGSVFHKNKKRCVDADSYEC